MIDQLTLEGPVVSTFTPDKTAIEQALAAPYLAVDIETDTTWGGIGPKKDFGLSYPAPVTIVSLAWREKIPEDYDGGDPVGDEIIYGYMRSTALVAPFDDYQLSVINRIMTSPNLVIAHNSVFDMRGLSKYAGAKTPNRIWDTMVMARLIHPQLHKNDRYDLVSLAKVFHIEIQDSQAEMKSKRGKLSEQDQTDVIRYALADAEVTLQIYETQQVLLDQVKSDDPGYHAELTDLINWEIRAMRVYAQMVAKGVRLNIPFMNKRVAELEQKTKQAFAILAEDGLTAPSSPKQRATYIYMTKGVPVPPYAPISEFYTEAAHKAVAKAKADNDSPVILRIEATAEKTENGVMISTLTAPISEQEIPGNPEAEPKIVTLPIEKLSTGGEVVDQLCGDSEAPYYNQLKALADFIACDRMLSTYRSLLDHAALDGRVHSLVAPMTHTGRRSSNHPQVQNWKTALAGEDDPAGDMCGIALGDTDDHTPVEIDYSNAENRIAALLSGDNKMAEACLSEDFHSAMAESYFGDRWREALKDKEEKKRLRKFSKTVTFGTAYGMGATLLSSRLGITLDEAREIIQNKEVAFPDVARAKKIAQNAAGTRGYVRLWTSRRVTCSSENAYRSWNYVCQGGVGEMVKRSIVLITEAYEANGMKSRIMLDQHDAIVISVYRPEAAEALAIASRIMESVIPADINENTDPVMSWIAQPDLAENAKKWGKFSPPVEIVSTDKPSGDNASPCANLTVKPGIVVTPAPANYKAVYRLDEIGFQRVIQFPLNAPLKSLSEAQVSEALDFYFDLTEALEQAANKKYLTQFPLDENGYIYAEGSASVTPSDPVEVGLQAWVVSPLYWSKTPDPEGLVGQTAEELLAEHTRRANWVSWLKTQVEEVAARFSALCKYAESIGAA